MNTPTLQTREHRQAWHLLPWYVNHTLDEEEHDRVERHLKGCPECRDEVHFLRAVAEGMEEMEDPEPAAGTEKALEAILHRLDAGTLETPSQAAAKESPIPKPASSPAPYRWVAWALAAQIVLLLFVAFFMSRLDWPVGRPASFRTLAAPQVAAPADRVLLRVVFQPEASEAELRAVLLEAGVAVVDGPTERGVYTVAVEIREAGAPSAASEALRDLSSRPQVLFVEVIDAPGGGTP